MWFPVAVGGGGGCFFCLTVKLKRRPGKQQEAGGESCCRSARTPVERRYVRGGILLPILYRDFHKSAS